jgi:hypothetical protein
MTGICRACGFYDWWVLRHRRGFLVQSVILRDRYCLLLGPYEEELALHGASGDSKFFRSD